jgi:drug/metabolite transporter (DMT)-like permease
MVFLLSFLAAGMCAVLNGVAVILEQTGASQEKTVTSSNPALLWRLRTNASYLLGLVLDLLAWVLTLYAVRSLPLFLVQPIIACSVVVTALIEVALFGRRLTVTFIVAVITIVVGLILLTLVSVPEPAGSISHASRLAIALCPLVILAAGTVLTRMSGRTPAYALSALSGIAFGGVAVAGRSINIGRGGPATILLNPLAWAVVLYGIVGILFFTIALQRAGALVVNAIMVATETLAPIAVGLLLLGDHARGGLWELATIGVAMTAGGALLIASIGGTYQSKTRRSPS